MCDTFRRAGREMATVAVLYPLGRAKSASLLGKVLILAWGMGMGKPTDTLVKNMSNELAGAQLTETPEEKKILSSSAARTGSTHYAEENLRWLDSRDMTMPGTMSDRTNNTCTSYNGRLRSGIDDPVTVTRHDFPWSISIL
jgi:hypothetical protein